MILLTVYVDVLLFINTLLNYAVLATADALLKRQCRLFRLIAGAFTGSLFSLTIFLDIGDGWSIPIKILSCALITAIVFGAKDLREYAKAALMTLSVSLVYSGAIILLYQVFRPPSLLIVNSVPYLRIDPLVMLGATAVIYLLLLILNRLFRERIRSTVVPLRYTVNGKEYRCIGKIDTACRLIEPFSRAPVIIVDSSVMPIAPEAPARVIPYSAVGISSFLRAVKADKVCIDKKEIYGTVYIASADQLDTHFRAIINSEIIR